MDNPWEITWRQEISPHHHWWLIVVMTVVALFLIGVGVTSGL